MGAGDMRVTRRKQQTPGIATNDTKDDTPKSNNKSTMNCRSYLCYTEKHQRPGLAINDTKHGTSKCNNDPTTNCRYQTAHEQH